MTCLLLSWQNILISFAFALSIVMSYRCGYDQYDHKTPYILNPTDKSHLRNTQISSDFQALRLYIDYTTLDSQTNYTNSFRNSIKQILNETQNLIEAVLMVKRLDSSRLSVENCSEEVQVSANVTAYGVAADFILFPFVMNSPLQDLEASGSTCIILSSNNRPLAGMIAFSANANFLKTNWLDYYTMIAFHELTHVLVMSSTKFDLFIDQNGQLIPSTEVYKNVTINGLQRTMIITPKVVAAAKKHFNCQTAIGVELENQGPTGTIGSHWEARTMLTDYMIGVTYDEMTISDITLALFEDSGWYKVNSYTGGLFRYGKNAGCAFLSNKCVFNGQTSFPNEFCTERYSQLCTTGRLSRGICYIEDQASGIDKGYQYFPQYPNSGGLLYADYCPISEVFSSNESYFSWSCSVGQPVYPKEIEQGISSSSVCMMSSLVNKTYESTVDTSLKQLRATCYSIICDFDKQMIIVRIGKNAVVCQTGGEISVTGYSGILICPMFQLVCTSQPMCSNMIECVQTKSVALDSTYDYVTGGSNYNSNGNQATSSTTSSSNSTSSVNTTIITTNTSTTQSSSSNTSSTSENSSTGNTTTSSTATTANHTTTGTSNLQNTTSTQNPIIVPVPNNEIGINVIFISIIGCILIPLL